jgi:hypothetical protein
MLRKKKKKKKKKAKQLFFKENMLQFCAETEQKNREVGSCKI